MPESPDIYSLRRIDLYLLGELDPDARKKVEADMAANPELAAEVERLRSRRLGVSLERFRERAAGRAPRAARLPQPRSWFTGGIGRGLAFASLLMMAGAFSYLAWIKPPAEETALRVKGAAGTEMRLRAGAREIREGELLLAAPGDTLALWYRSGEATYAQIWWREGAGAAAPADARSDSGAFWPVSLAWTFVPPSWVVTEGAPQGEVWIVTSGHPFDQSMVRRAMDEDLLEKKFRVLRFRIQQKAKGIR